MVAIPGKVEFFNRLKQELDRQYIRGFIAVYDADHVHYEDFKPTLGEFPDSGTQVKKLRPAFYKRALYEHQNEFRLAFEKRAVVSTGGACTLNIGDISDITFYAKTSDPLIFQASKTTP